MKYLLSDKKTFDLFDRISCTKQFLYCEDEKMKLIKIFSSNKNTEGLLWMYRQLCFHDKNQSSYPIEKDNGYNGQSLGFLFTMKELMTYAEYLDFLRKSKAEE